MQMKHYETDDFDYEEEFYDEHYTMEEDIALMNYLDGRIDMSRCYSPSAPWYAPGMSVKDFI